MISNSLFCIVALWLINLWCYHSVNSQACLYKSNSYFQKFMVGQQRVRQNCGDQSKMDMEYMKNQNTDQYCGELQKVCADAKCIYSKGPEVMPNHISWFRLHMPSFKKYYCACWSEKFDQALEFSKKIVPPKGYDSNHCEQVTLSDKIKCELEDQHGCAKNDLYTSTCVWNANNHWAKQQIDRNKFWEDVFLHTIDEIQRLSLLKYDETPKLIPIPIPGGKDGEYTEIKVLPFTAFSMPVIDRADINAFDIDAVPFVGMLIIKLDEGYMHCTLTFIRRKWALTAAHCVVSAGKEEYLNTNYKGAIKPGKSPYGSQLLYLDPKKFKVYHSSKVKGKSFEQILQSHDGIDVEAILTPNGFLFAQSHNVHVSEQDTDCSKVFFPIAYSGNYDIALIKLKTSFIPEPKTKPPPQKASLSQKKQAQTQYDQELKQINKQYATVSLAYMPSEVYEKSAHHEKTPLKTYETYGYPGVPQIYKSIGQPMRINRAFEYQFAKIDKNGMLLTTGGQSGMGLLDYDAHNKGFKIIGVYSGRQFADYPPGYQAGPVPCLRGSYFTKIDVNTFNQIVKIINSEEQHHAHLSHNNWYGEKLKIFRLKQAIKHAKLKEKKLTHEIRTQEHKLRHYRY